MSLQDIQVVDPGGKSFPGAIPFLTEGGATNILAGEPVKVGGTGSNYVIPLATAEPTDSVQMVGLATTTSTETASADGTVDILLAIPGIVYRCDATTKANIDTEAKLLLLRNDRVAFDLTGSIFTVDENQGDAATNGLMIIGGDIVNGTIDFTIRPGATRQD